MGLHLTPEEEQIINENFSNQYAELNCKINLLEGMIADYKKCGTCKLHDTKSKTTFKPCIHGLRHSESLPCKDWKVRE